MDTKLRQLERAAQSGDPEAEARLERERERACIYPPMSLLIDGDEFEVVEVIHNYARGQMAMVRTDEQWEFYLALDSESAGELAADYWRDMARDDATEFRHLVGDDALVSWALGEYAGPGSTQVRSLDEWLELWVNTPEEQWASYDGVECEVERVSEDIISEIGFTPTVAYRAN